MIWLALLSFQFPSDYFQNWAEELAVWSRNLYSDDPNIYRYTWTARMVGPCPDIAATLDDNPANLPCTVTPFIPIDPRQSQPAALYTLYQNVTYTAPEEGKNPPKATLALNWTIDMIGPGTHWRMTVNAEGIKHDLWLIQYDPFETEITIIPGILEINVTMLRPGIFHHLTVKPTGSYTLEAHKISRLQLPLSSASVGLFYDIMPLTEFKCGGTAFQYTTKPAEVLMDLIQNLVPDAAEVLPGDRQVIISPALGFWGCGEYSYKKHHRFMLHREPSIPNLVEDGPPLEIWTETDQRDKGEHTRAVIAPNLGKTITNSEVQKVRDALQSLGLQGDFMPDPDMAAAMDRQEVESRTNYKSGTQNHESAMALITMLEANPTDPNLRALYEEYVRPNVDEIERMGDTEIEFNPLSHCPTDPVPGVEPILGEHFFEFPIKRCAFCEYHNRITFQPYQSWSHSRLMRLRWIWGELHDGKGNLYEKSFRYIQTIIGADAPNQSRAAEELAARQRAEGGIPPITMAGLEATPSTTTQNTVSSHVEESIPDFFREYDRCRDPSWTLRYRFRYGEVEDILLGSGPCSKLWDVSR